MCSDIYLHRYRPGFLPVRQWTDRMDRFRSAVRLARPTGRPISTSCFWQRVWLACFWRVDYLWFTVPGRVGSLYSWRNWWHHHAQYRSNPGQLYKYTRKAFSDSLLDCDDFHILSFVLFCIYPCQMEDVVHHGWLELNQGTRNLVQSNVSRDYDDGKLSGSIITLNILYGHHIIKKRQPFERWFITVLDSSKAVSRARAQWAEMKKIPKQQQQMARWPLWFCTSAILTIPRTGLHQPAFTVRMRCCSAFYFFHQGFVMTFIYIVDLYNKKMKIPLVHRAWCWALW